MDDYVEGKEALNTKTHTSASATKEKGSPFGIHTQLPLKLTLFLIKTPRQPNQ